MVVIVEKQFYFSIMFCICERLFLEKAEYDMISLCKRQLFEEIV